MKWHLFECEEHPGKFNMQLDIDLARNCKPGEAFLRFYKWKPYCISIGANQKFDDINIRLAGKNNLDVVKRPTGGRAILHAEELTYSVVLPNSLKLSNENIYNKISLALQKGLIKFNKIFSVIELEKLNPDLRENYKNPSGMLCFSSTAKHEIKFEGKKLVGSAQRRMEQSILQHGSILTGSYHQNIVNYLNIEDDLKTEIRNDILRKTIEMDTILNSKTDYAKLIDSLIEGFSEVWQIDRFN